MIIWILIIIICCCFFKMKKIVKVAVIGSMLLVLAGIMFLPLNYTYLISYAIGKYIGPVFLIVIVIKGLSWFNPPNIDEIEKKYNKDRTLEIKNYTNENFENNPVDYHLQENTILRNRYVICSVIGEGGFGITYKGKDNQWNNVIAIKEYYPKDYVQRNTSVSADLSIISGEKKMIYEQGKKRFLKEAAIMTKFVGEPGLVTVKDCFEENNTAYIIMEYLEGITLKEYIKQAGKMPSEKVFTAMKPLMQSLSLIHQNGLIHRDISPDNIMLVADGSFKLLDFGAAKDYSMAGKESMTVVLKRGYAPEEQYYSHGLQGPWTDIYALCATIYTCITGLVPDESIQREIKDEMRWPSALGIEIYPIYEQALRKGMNVLPKNRFQSMEEFLQFIQ